MSFSINPLSRFNTFMRGFWNAMPPLIQGFFALIIIGYIIVALIHLFNK